MDQISGHIIEYAQVVLFVHLGFALECILKSLIQIEQSKNKWGHKLYDDLWNMLGQNLKNEIYDIYMREFSKSNELISVNNMKNFEIEIQKISEIFVKDRYSYEDGNWPQDVAAKITFGTCFYEAINKYILSKKVVGKRSS